MEFSKVDDLAKYLAEINTAYGAYAAKLWEPGKFRTQRQLANASVQTYERYEVPPAHAEDIKVQAGATQAAVPGKRHQEDDDSSEEPKRRKKHGDYKKKSVAEVAPSSFTDDAWNEQQAKGLYLCFCPDENAPKLPVELIDPTFGEFVDFVENPQPYQFTEEQYSKAIEFCRNMCSKITGGEEVRQGYVQHMLRFFTGHEVQSSKHEPQIGYFHASGAKPDAFVEIEAMLMPLLGEVKKEMARGTVPADRQGLLYFQKYWIEREDTVVFNCSSCPCFLVCVVGNVFCVYALAFGSKVTMVPLTPYIHAINWRRFGRHRMEPILRALVALGAGVNSIIRRMAWVKAPSLQPEYEQLAKDVWEGKKSDMVCMVPAYIVEADLPYRLSNPQFVVTRVQGFDEKFVYIVRWGEHVSLFKYTQSYSKPVHGLLAVNKLAPRLDHCIKLPGGWWEVKMEYLAPEDGWSTLHATLSSGMALAQTQLLLTDLQQALARVHAIDANGQKIALGDCRSANVMAKGYDGSGEESHLRFIDFDSSGFEGQAKYPAYRNPQIKWPADAGSLMAQAHDWTLLFESIGRPCPAFASAIASAVVA